MTLVGSRSAVVNHRFASCRSQHLHFPGIPIKPMNASLRYPSRLAVWLGLFTAPAILSAQPAATRSPSAVAAAKEETVVPLRSR